MITLFFGADDLARSEAVGERKARIPVDVADLNITVLDGRKFKLDAFTAACDALPFLADTRLVIVEGALKHLKAGKVRDDLREYLPQVPASTDLLFVEDNDFDKRSSLFLYLKKAGEVREFQPLQGADLQRWLVERARGLGVRLLPEAGALLVEFAGNDSRALLNELAKLAMYVGPGASIGAREVRLLVPDTGESSVFDFVDALAGRRMGPALQLLHELFVDGVAPTYLLFMVGRQIRILLGVAELATRRMRPDEIATELGQKPFVIKKTLGQVGHFDRAALLQLHDRLAELDHWSKTGRIEAETALELLVAETCASPVRTPRSLVR